MPSKPTLVVGFLNKIAALILTVHCETFLLFGNVLTDYSKLGNLLIFFFGTPPSPLWQLPKTSMSSCHNSMIPHMLYKLIVWWSNNLCICCTAYQTQMDCIGYSYSRLMWSSLDMCHYCRMLFDLSPIEAWTIRSDYLIVNVLMRDSCIPGMFCLCLVSFQPDM